MDPNTQTPLRNTISFDDMKAAAIELGTQSGKGRDTQIKFLLKTVEGAYHGAMDTVANKHGSDIDDSTLLAEAYVKASQGAVVFDAKAPNQRKLISCLRTCVKLGQWPKGGNGEPLATVNNLMSMRQKLLKSGMKNLDDAANTLLKYARAQLKADQLLDDNVLKQFCYRPGKNAQSVEDVIESMRNRLNKLVAGKGGLQDNDQLVRDAASSLTKRLAAIAKIKGGGGTV